MIDGSEAQTVKTRPWSLEESLKSDDDIAHYLDAVIEDGDVDLLLDALGVIARKRGMTEVARRAGLGRESLYRALSAKGDPQLSTLVKVLGALGLRLRFAAA
jgi:probable addiction module antidote protein